MVHVALVTVVPRPAEFRLTLSTLRSSVPGKHDGIAGPSEGPCPARAVDILDGGGALALGYFTLRWMPKGTPGPTCSRCQPSLGGGA